MSERKGSGDTAARDERNAAVEDALRSGTRDLLEREGVGALTARRIATASGRSTMCIYSHFGGTGALLTSVFLEARAQALAAVEGDEPDAARSWLDWARRHPGTYRLLFEHDLAPLGVDPNLRRTLIDEIAARMGEGEAGYRQWALVHGVIALEVAVGPDSTPPNSSSWTRFAVKLIARCCGVTEPRPPRGSTAL